VVLNRGGAAGVADGVNANDKAFLGTFPYLAEPHTAAAGAPPPATGTGIRPPSTGDGGIFDDSGTLWAASAVMLAVALGLGAGGAVAAVKSR
jgi:hypothetical protein